LELDKRGSRSKGVVRRVRRVNVVGFKRVVRTRLKVPGTREATEIEEELSSAQCSAVQCSEVQYSVVQCSAEYSTVLHQSSKHEDKDEYKVE
jgi:hypothetical protein